MAVRNIYCTSENNLHIVAKPQNCFDFIIFPYHMYE